jgi:hypothetical protein
VKTIILAGVALYVMSASAAWALPEGHTAEAWIGNEYDSWWNEHRSELLQLWERHSFQPDDSSECLAVGRVWYCPASDTLAQKN